VLVFEISVKVKFKPGNRGVAPRLGLCTRTGVTMSSTRQTVICSAKVHSELKKERLRILSTRDVENCVS
jgi:hypothetical protein